MTDAALIAALETSGPAGSVALLRGDAVLGATALGGGTRHGAALHPALAALLDDAGASATDLDLVVVGTGPGSYTGMRVGVAAARALAFAAGCPVVGVPSFLALALALPATLPCVAVARDARRGAVWFAAWGPAGDGPERPVLVPPSRLSIADAAATLPEGATVRGDAALLLTDPSAGGRADLVADTRPDRDAADAAVLGRLGRARVLRDGAPDPATVVPLYLQPPHATPRRGKA